MARSHPRPCVLGCLNLSTCLRGVHRFENPCKLGPGCVPESNQVRAREQRPRQARQAAVGREDFGRAYVRRHIRAGSQGPHPEQLEEVGRRGTPP